MTVVALAAEEADWPVRLDGAGADVVTVETLAPDEALTRDGAADIAAHVVRTAPQTELTLSVA